MGFKKNRCYGSLIALVFCKIDVVMLLSRNQDIVFCSTTPMLFITTQIILKVAYFGIGNM